MNEDISKVASLLGKLGGKVTSAKYGKDYYRKIGKKGTETKRKRKLAAKQNTITP